MPGASRTIVIDAPPEKVFDVISDYAHYPEFMSEVRGIQVKNRQGNEADVYYEVDLVKRIKYALHMKEERPKKLSWSFIEGDWMRDNKGSWALEPTADGKTQVTYSIEMALGPLVPKAIVNALVDQSLPKMLEATRKRVESLG